MEKEKETNLNANPIVHPCGSNMLMKKITREFEITAEVIFITSIEIFCMIRYLS